MALSDTKLRTLAPRNRPWQLADHDGLVIEVLPTGRKIWRFRYRFDNKSQQITLGEYPAFSLAEARLWREKCRSLVAHGINPAQKKQEEKLKQKDPTTVKTFAKRWLTDIVEKSNRDPRNITRVIEKDIIPINREAGTRRTHNCPHSGRARPHQATRFGSRRITDVKRA